MEPPADEDPLAGEQAPTSPDGLVMLESTEEPIPPEESSSSVEVPQILEGGDGTMVPAEISAAEKAFQSN